VVVLFYNFFFSTDSCGMVGVGGVIGGVGLSSC